MECAKIINVSLYIKDSIGTILLIIFCGGHRTYVFIACEQQTHFRSSLLSLRKIAIFRRERRDDRKCVCCSQANGFRVRAGLCSTRCYKHLHSETVTSSTRPISSPGLLPELSFCKGKPWGRDCNKPNGCDIFYFNENSNFSKYIFGKNSNIFHARLKNVI